MKSALTLANDALRAFVQGHPEIDLESSRMNSLTIHIAGKEKIYAKMAIDFAVTYIIEQIQLEQGVKKPRKDKLE